MNNSKTRQQWIYDLLIGEPTLSFGDCFSKYSAKFSKSQKTFSKDWKIARQRFSEYQKTIESEKLKVSIETEKEAVKKNILTKHACMEILSKIAKGVAIKVDNKTVMPKTIDRIKAISELAKYEGWYATEKVDVTTKGEKLNRSIQIEIISKPEEVRNNEDTDN